ncbi:MAG TPA: hypothetical protein VF412_18530 [Bdellovibrio sp.]|uniref:hypothetical protein n=1 Tax=Bdellovibrio sp. TaxID=28201 RepID=UPI002F015F6B
MKKVVLEILLAIAIIWASTSTFLYLQLKNNPRVVAVTTGVNSSLSQESVQLSELEKITFLRQYLDRYFTYDSNNFWQSQTSLTFLMAPELRASRIDEVRRLREKIQQKNLTQKSDLLSLASQGNNRFSAVISLQLNEDQNKSILITTLSLELGSTERTLENPWGLLVRKMDFVKSSTDAIAFNSHLKIKPKVPLSITLPCAIENIESSSETTLKTKITTLNVSEIQLSTASSLKEPVQMKALCKDKEFSFDVVSANENPDLFVAFPISAGVERKKEIPTANQPGKPRKKDIYEKTIENVLGIKVDN